MSEEIIKLDGIEGVRVSLSPHALNLKLQRLELSMWTQSVICRSENQTALAQAEAIDVILDRALMSSNSAKIQLLQLMRQVEDVYVTFTRDLENEMHRLRNLSGAYNAAKEQAERKDNVV